MCNILQFDDPRLEVNCDAKKILVLNVYLPYDNGDNCDDYMYYLAMINSIVTDFPSPYSIVCGDF